jgi:small-conductance mechanosensitive channel
VGAELIVPNANLVSNNVVNWTLTRSGWQISLPFLVGGAVAAENIIPLLVNAAEGNPAVLREPQPAAYLKNSVANGSLFELSFSTRPCRPSACAAM